MQAMCWGADGEASGAIFTVGVGSVGTDAAVVIVDTAFILVFAGVSGGRDFAASVAVFSFDFVGNVEDVFVFAVSVSFLSARAPSREQGEIESGRS